MKIDLKESFLKRLGNQIDFIAKNNPQNARKFKNNLLNRIKEIPSNPYKFRKSIYYEDEKIRDLIYKGYTIVFRINDKVIEVFGFVKYRNNLMG
jgi:plasmid stabilization system protein ParE